MKPSESANGANIFIDIGQSSIEAISGGDVFAFPIERGANGRLTDLCRERLTVSLRGFLGNRVRGAGRLACCAVGARGVSMRRMSLPASSKDELQRVLRLQIEGEFPVSPDELAWGSQPIGPPKAQAGGVSARQELLVAAVKKESLEEYAAILAACGVMPVFTLAALARARVHPPPEAGTCAVLDIGRFQSELVCFENGFPAAIRILAWGGDAITRAIQEKLSLGHDEAEKLKRTLDQPGALSGPQAQSLQSARESALSTLAEVIKPASPGGRIYLTGKSARDPQIAPHLARLLGSAAACESLEPAVATGPSAAIAGLIKSTGKDSASPPLVLELGSGQGAVKQARPATWKWAAAAALLALGALAFPFVEAITLKPVMERKLAALESDRGRLGVIDQELDFLKYLKQNQAPYLEVIYLLARSAPQGARVENLSMGRRQQISMQWKMENAQQVSDFRSKLIDSGWFANVIVEEQAPSPDRHVSVRMTAELKPAESRKPIAPETPGKKSERPPPSGPPPGFDMPPPEPMMIPPPEQAPVPAEVSPAPPSPDQDTPKPARRPRRLRTEPTPDP